MKNSRFTEEQVACALRQAEAGTPVGDACRQMRIAEATFYVFRRKYGQLGVTEPRKMRMPRRRASAVPARFRATPAGPPPQATTGCLPPRPTGTPVHRSLP